MLARQTMSGLLAGINVDLRNYHHYTSVETLAILMVLDILLLSI
jgi:hypothetical protein